MGARTLRKRSAEDSAGNKTTQKRKRQVKADESFPSNRDILPHNLGLATSVKKDLGTNAGPLHDQAEEDKRVVKQEDPEAADTIPENGSEEQSRSVQQATPTSSRILRPRRSTAKPIYADPQDSEADSKKKAAASIKKRSVPKKEIKEEDDEGAIAAKPNRKTAKKTKDNPYGLTPGITPFPDWTAPSAEDCEQVYKRLAKVHGEAKAPDRIPAPSLDVSGCGEVPSVLDAMIRTRLSAHTSSKNSTAAFKGLVDKFGIVEEGIGKGSVNWNKVRLAPLGDVIEAIKCGGLAQIKSKDIKTILQMVYDENEMRREAFIEERKSGKAAAIPGSLEKTQGQKDLEILKAEQDVLSLDHVHGMHPEEAMPALTKYPGIGVKTASCVILFCLQQPSFAVDTHVHRISGWLKWIPLEATRDEAFSHLEVRIPNSLKYGLHKLFVQHGKTCLKCRANTSEGTEGWDAADCPLEDVIDRVGKRKSSGKAVASKRKATRPKEEYSDSD